MKTFKIVLTALAFTAGIGGAFIAKAIGSTQSYFYLDASGNPKTRIVGLPSCDPGTDDCAQLWNVDSNNQPTTPAGNPLEGAIHS